MKTYRPRCKKLKRYFSPVKAKTGWFPSKKYRQGPGRYFPEAPTRPQQLSHQMGTVLLFL